MQDISKLKEETSKYLDSKFSISPQESSITLYTPKAWEEFLKITGVPGCQGLYFPYNLTAHILYNNHSNILLFHEYFGHGLYTEYTPQGTEQHNLERQLAEDMNTTKAKTEYGNPEKGSMERIQGELDKIYKRFRLPQEGFAYWMDWHLAKLTGLTEQSEETRANMPDDERDAFNRFCAYEQEYGEHALMYSTGFPKHYDRQILETILRNVFKDKFNSIDLALAYGSRKPYSDIDMFIVSDDIPSTNFGWLDIYSMSREQFRQLSSNLDISLTDPMFTGEFITGDRARLEQEKKRMLDMPITPDMADFHMNHAPKAKALALQHPEGTKPHKTAMRYSKTYLANAMELRQGRKALTLRTIQSRYDI